MVRWKIKRCKVKLINEEARTVVMHRGSDRLRGGIATHLDASISIGRWTFHPTGDRHRVVDARNIVHDRGVLDRAITIVHSTWGDRTAGGCRWRLLCDWDSIAMQSWCDWTAIVALLWAIMPRVLRSEGPRSSCDRGHHFQRIKRL